MASSALLVGLALLVAGGLMVWQASSPVFVLCSPGARSRVAHPGHLRPVRAVHAAAQRSGHPAAVRRLSGHEPRRRACAPPTRSTRARKLSLRARNLNGDRLKVNDKRGNPIEIAAVVVWHVEDTAKAAFDVDDYENFVKVQSEAAVRHLASSFAYDADESVRRRRSASPRCSKAPTSWRARS